MARYGTIGRVLGERKEDTTQGQKDGAKRVEEVDGDFCLYGHWLRRDQGPQGLGTAILRRRASLFLSSSSHHPSRRDSFASPCSELLITFACISTFFLLLAPLRPLVSLAVSLRHALCIWRSRDKRGLCGRTGPLFPRKKSRIGFAANRDSRVDEKA